MAHNDLMFTEINVQIGGNAITFVGAFTLPDVQPMIDKWFDALNLGATAAQEAAMAAQLKEADNQLKAAIDANTP
jgi:hypothetical protein